MDRRPVLSLLVQLSEKCSSPLCSVFSADIKNDFCDCCFPPASRSAASRSCSVRMVRDFPSSPWVSHSRAPTEGGTFLPAAGVARDRNAKFRSSGCSRTSSISRQHGMTVPAHPHRPHHWHPEEQSPPRRASHFNRGLGDNSACYPTTLSNPTAPTPTKRNALKRSLWARCAVWSLYLRGL